MSWMAAAVALPALLGGASELGLFGKEAKEGKKVEYEPQAPKYQQDFAQEFFKYLQGQIGQGATPYPGQVAAPAVNPFTQGAFGAMKASPYGSFMGNLPMGGTPFVPPQPPVTPPRTPYTPPQQPPPGHWVPPPLRPQKPPPFTRQYTTGKGEGRKKDQFGDPFIPIA